MLNENENKLVYRIEAYGTAVHHIHAFTIHVSVLILAKGLLYARNSRLVSDKLELGFRYPCDGPGRGGTCQISPFDHIYLAVFWMYNSLDIVLFNSFIIKLTPSCEQTVHNLGFSHSKTPIVNNLFTNWGFRILRPQ